MLMDNLYRLLTGNTDPSFWMYYGAIFEGEGEGGGGGSDPFYGEFEVGVKDHPSIMKFKDSQTLAKSYIELEKKISSKGVVIPGENPTEAEINDFHKGIGRPDNADKYEFTVADDTDIRLKPSDEAIKSFRDVAFKVGLSPKQFTALKDWNHEQGASALKGIDDTATSTKAEAENKLKVEWGSSYNEKIILAQKVVKLYAGEEGAKELGSLGNNPAALRMLANIGKTISESNFGDLGVNNLGITPAEAKAECDKIMSDSKYMDGTHPEQKQLKERLDTLYKIRFPEDKK